MAKSVQFFRDFPIGETFRARSDGLLSFRERLAMPFRRDDFRFPLGKIPPQRLHQTQFFGKISRKDFIAYRLIYSDQSRVP